MELMRLSILFHIIKSIVAINNGFPNPLNHQFTQQYTQELPHSRTNIEKYPNSRTNEKFLIPIILDIRIEGSSDKIDYLEHRDGGTYSCNSRYGISTVIDSSIVDEFSRPEMIYKATNESEYAYAVQVENITPESKNIILRLNGNFIKLTKKNNWIRNDRITLESNNWIRSDRITLDIKENCDNCNYQIIGSRNSTIFNSVFKDEDIPDRDCYTNYVAMNGNLFNRIIEGNDLVIWESNNPLECIREVSLYVKNNEKYLGFLSNNFNYFLYHWDKYFWKNITNFNTKHLTLKTTSELLGETTQLLEPTTELLKPTSELLKPTSELLGEKVGLGDEMINLRELKFYFNNENELKSIEELPGSYSISLYCLRYCVEFYFPKFNLSPNEVLADVFIYNLLDNSISLRLRNRTIIPINNTTHNIKLCINSSVTVSGTTETTGTNTTVVPGTEDTNTTANTHTNTTNTNNTNTTNTTNTNTTNTNTGPTSYTNTNTDNTGPTSYTKDSKDSNTGTGTNIGVGCRVPNTVTEDIVTVVPDTVTETNTNIELEYIINSLKIAKNLENTENLQDTDNLQDTENYVTKLKNPLNSLEDSLNSLENSLNTFENSLNSLLKRVNTPINSINPLDPVENPLESVENPLDRTNELENSVKKISIDINNVNSTKEYNIYIKNELKEFKPFRDYSFGEVLESDGRVQEKIWSSEDPEETVKHMTYFNGVVEKYLLMFINNKKYLLFRYVIWENRWTDVTGTSVNLSGLKFFTESGAESDYRIFTFSYNFEIAFKTPCHKVTYYKAVLWSNEETECKKIHKIVIKPIVNRLHIFFMNNKIRRFNVTNDCISFISEDDCIFYKNNPLK